MSDPRAMITELARARAQAAALKAQGKKHRISITITVVDELIQLLSEYETMLAKEGGSH
jgi:sensor histidine kinase YesM